MSERESLGVARGLTVWAWLDTTYYDGLWQFALGCYTGAGYVAFCGQPLVQVEATA